MSQKNRLPFGGIIDRSRPLKFTFNGKPYTGFKGDTLASALLANNVHLVARSFKYHRPRGIFSAGTEEPNAMVQLETGAHTEPNPKATQIELYDGLSATSVNCWPSVDFDLQAVNSLFAKFLPVGFYYKTMFGSPWAWHKIFEPFVRKSAGWGKAPTEADPDFYDHTHVHCDILIVGAGPAGLAAATLAASSGARVILADEQSQFGGSLLGNNRTIDNMSGTDWVKDQSAILQQSAQTTRLPRTTVFGYYDQNYLLALERKTNHTGAQSSPETVKQRLWHIRAKQVILATGAHERPLVFADNDRPGIMLASAAQTYANRYATLPGKNAVFFTNNDSAYEAALDYQKAGAKIAAIIDTRANPDGQLVEAARAANIRLIDGAAITATHGKKHIKSVTVQSYDGNTVTGKKRRIACDCLFSSGGHSPVVHLFSQSGGKLKFDADLSAFRPDIYRQDTQSTGSANGTMSLAATLREAQQAATTALINCGFKTENTALIATSEPNLPAPEPAWLIPGIKKIGHGKAKHFIDFQNDSTAADIALAVREGFASVEHMKRYTLTGFGTDQGKTGNINALAILAQTTGATIPQTGTTTFRPPYTPVTFGALAGRELGELSDPIRLTTIHSAHIEAQAEMENVGQWKRPWYFPRKITVGKRGETARETMDQATNRECLALRNSVGIMDASTLGKIDIQGTDAAKFLDRIYTNGWQKLAVGRARYGLMCHEDGMVFDDGVTTRLGENHYHMTTTTGGAAGVFDWLEEYLQTEWPDLQVYLTSVTEQWATIGIGGPNARAVMERLNPKSDWSNEAFPFMAMQNHVLAGCSARVFRISFTGELSYEINVPNRYGLAMWQACMSAGRSFNITPYGTEAMHILRAEKGFIITGQETDGTQTPQDLGMDWIVSKQKPDFVGKRSFSRTDTARPDRKHLVGLMTQDPKFVLDEGAQIIENNALGKKSVKPVPMLGHATSSYWSANLDHSIALALVKNGRNRIGDTLQTYSLGQSHPVTLVEPIFYDREGARRDG